MRAQEATALVAEHSRWDHGSGSGTSGVAARWSTLPPAPLLPQQPGMQTHHRVICIMVGVFSGGHLRTPAGRGVLAQYFPAELGGLCLGLHGKWTLLSPQRCSLTLQSTHLSIPARGELVLQAQGGPCLPEGLWPAEVWAALSIPSTRLPVLPSYMERDSSLLAGHK